MKAAILFSLLVALTVFIGLNYRQMYAMWAIRREHQRLITEMIDPHHENPASLEDRFDNNLLHEFWKFIIINGGGKVSTGSTQRVSNETAWHAAAITAKQGLTIYHFPDATFENESSNLFDKPAAGQYNNVSLIGGSGYQPTLKEDVALEFSMQTGNTFYGTAGVIFQSVGTLQKDGVFVKPFDMFGVSVVGDESSVMGYNGPLCYLALDWNPVRIEPLHIDSHTWHNYKIRLRMLNNTEWLGVVYVDGAKLCSLSLPPFGPVEVHVWSDNYLVTSTLKRWWEFAPAMDLKFQDGGDKLFHLGKINIYTEVR